MTHRFGLAFLVGALILSPVGLPSALAEDWPQFRHDPGRTAASSEELPADLQLLWVRHLLAPRPAFPGEVRLRYDLSYEPVVRGKRMYVPSMVTDSVAALNTETGEEEWRFYAEGPVRFAPVAGPAKVYIVSDDGFLYALNASDGSLCWKFRDLPADQPDRKILGHQRLISLWPARGGPVLHGGRIYFAAGLWPAYRTSVHALDAETGDVVWSNKDSHRIPAANMDHGIGQYAGLTPQGYLAVVAGKLVVPCGAQLPAFLDLETGELDTYCMGWGGRVGLPKGSWFVAGVGDILSHSGDLYDITRPNEEEFRDPRNRRDFKSQLYAGGWLRLQIDPYNQRALGPFQEPVLTPEAIYFNDPEVAAHDLTSGRLQEFGAEGVPVHRKNDQYPDHLEMRFDRKWKLPLASTVHIKAGDSLVTASATTVEVIRIPEGDEKPEITWQARVEGEPHRLLAADDKLFLVTREGSISAFGSATGSPPAVHDRPAPETRSQYGWTERVAGLLETTHVTEGYVVVLGVESGRLVEELVHQTEAFVIAVDEDPDRVHRVRGRLHRSGLYGTRASLHVAEPFTFPLPPFLANLVVSENWDRVSAASPQALAQAVALLLRPYGGTACWGRERIDPGIVRECVEAPEEGRVEVHEQEDLILVRRDGRLPGAADWSHARANAANTGATQDTFVKPPLDLLWFDGALRWHRKPGQVEVRVAGGRVLIKAARLHALDAYTGRVLWACDLPFPHTPLDQLVVSEEGILVTGGKTCVVIDARTGSTTRRLELPADFKGPWIHLKAAGGRLVGQSGDQIFSLDARSGKVDWRFAGSGSNLSLAVGDGKVFCAEIPNQRRGDIEQEPKTRAFDLLEGDVLWEVDGGSRVAYSERHDLLVTANGIYRGEDGSLVAETSRFASSLGDQACELLSVIGDQVLWGTQTSFVTYDLSTGSPVDQPLAWVRRGCTNLRASTHLITTRFKANSAYIDTSTRKITSLWNIRPGCNNNLFPADGVLSLPNLTGGCECNYTPTSQAYVPRSVITRSRLLRE